MLQYLVVRCWARSSRCRSSLPLASEPSWSTVVLLKETGGVKRRGLIQPVIQRIQQRAMNAEAGPYRGLAGSKKIVGHADAGLGHKR